MAHLDYLDKLTEDFGSDDSDSLRINSLKSLEELRPSNSAPSDPEEWRSALEKIIKDFDFDFAFFVQSKRDERGDIQVLQLVRVNICESYLEKYLEIRRKGYKDYVYLARFILKLSGVISRSQMYSNPVYRDALGITGEYNNDPYQVLFHSLFGIEDGATYGYTDLTTQIDYNFSFGLRKQGHPKKISQRSQSLVTDQDRTNFQNAIDIIAPFFKNWFAVPATGLPQPAPLMPEVSLRSQQKAKWLRLLDCFPNVICDGAFDSFLRCLMSLLKASGALHAHVRLEDQSLSIISKTLIGLPETYEQLYSTNAEKGSDHTDILFRAPHEYGFHKAYALHHLDPGYKRSLFFLEFAIYFDIDDVMTYALPDVDGSSFHYFSIFRNDEKKKRTLSEKILTTNPFSIDSIFQYREIMNFVCLFHGKRLNVDESFNPWITMPLSEDPIQINREKELERENRQLRKAIEAMGARVEDVVDTNVETPQEQWVRLCPELQNWPNNHADKEKVLNRVKDPESGRSRLENAKEFLDRLLAESNVEGVPYLHELRSINPAFAYALNQLATRKKVKTSSLIPVAKERTDHTNVTEAEYREAAKIVGAYLYRRKKENK
ncbi:MAG: hypothetical protein GKR96_12230 [Gammaproteobacteria bacterium]|nr:hypothetical protein [Gammaproteobacteria bacterium]